MFVLMGVGMLLLMGVYALIDMWRTLPSAQSMLIDFSPLQQIVINLITAVRKIS